MSSPRRVMSSPRRVMSSPRRVLPRTSPVAVALAPDAVAQRHDAATGQIVFHTGLPHCEGQMLSCEVDMITTSGRTSPTLLQRSNSIRTTQAGSPSSSRSDLLSWPHSPHPRFPRATPESSLTTELIRASPRFRSTSGQFTRSGTTLSRKGCGRVLKRGGAFCFLVLFFWFALEWLYLSRFQQPVPQPAKNLGSSRADNIVREGGLKDRSFAVLHERLLALAAHELAENEFKPEPDDLWEETIQNDTTWLPCANQRPQEHIPPSLPEDSTGYIMINANGGLSQQRVAICNGVAVARMLNATVVLPRFVVSSVWRDSSQFKDLYVEDYFIDYLKDDVRIVKELPVELQPLDLDAIEAVVTEDDVPKEVEPSFCLKHILPLLLKTRVVLFEGFGNRLAFDPVAFDIQTLRCRCNFHALKIRSGVAKNRGSDCRMDARQAFPLGPN